MANPKPKTTTEEPEYALHPEDREGFAQPGFDDVLDIDVQAHLQCLETGEGELWPPAQRR